MESLILRAPLCGANKKKGKQTKHKLTKPNPYPRSSSRRSPCHNPSHRETTAELKTQEEIRSCKRKKSYANQTKNFPNQTRVNQTKPVMLIPGAAHTVPPVTPQSQGNHRRVKNSERN